MLKKLRVLLLGSFLILLTGNLAAQDDSLFVEIQNSPIQIFVGDSVLVDAVLKDTNDVEFDTTFSWSVVPDSLGTIDSTGYFYAGDTGSGFIYAELGELKDSVEVEVLEQPENDGYPYLVIYPDGKELLVGENFQFNAKLVEGEGVETDTTVIWQTEFDSVATVDSSGNLTGVGPGETFLIATLDSLADSVTVSVIDSTNDDEYPYLDIVPDSTEIMAGSGFKFHAKYVAGEYDVRDTTVTWQVENDSIATVDSEGYLTGVTVGQTFLLASLGALSDSAFVSVVEDSTGGDDGDDGFPYISIVPDSTEILVGGNFQFHAKFYASESDVRDTSVTWQVEDDSVATVDSTGFLTGIKAGQTLLVAVLDSLADSASISVIDSTGDDDSEFPYLLVVPEEAELQVGDSLQFSAIFVAGEDDLRDTTVTWYLSYGNKASIDSTGLLKALNPGELVVSAVLDSLLAEAEVEIYDTTDGDDEDHHHINVEPKESIVNVGDTIQFTAYYQFDEDSSAADSNFTWSLDGMPVGTISETGLFTANSTGFTLVYAHLEDGTFGTAFVIVVDSTSEDAEINNITITKSTDDYGSGSGGDDFKVMKTLKEGEVWKLSALPQPMSFLNGGCVYFPVGSLKEDITIHLDVPYFNEGQEDSSGFGAAGVVSAVDFQVYVGDSLAEPYYFEEPLIFGLAFEKGLLENLNIDPYTVALYFTYYESDSLHFDSTGIAYGTIDPHRNRIYSTVEHFSTLTAKGEENSITSIDNEIEEIPNNYELYQNYPNPFNPSTTITYSLPKDGKVKLIIYDILGREVATLINKVQTAGIKSVIWNGINSNGRQVTSGVYLYQLQAGDIIQTRKMMLLK